MAIGRRCRRTSSGLVCTGRGDRHSTPPERQRCTWYSTGPGLKCDVSQATERPCSATEHHQPDERRADGAPPCRGGARRRPGPRNLRRPRRATPRCGTSRAGATSTSPAASRCSTPAIATRRSIAAVKAQLELYTHTCFQVLAYEPYVELAERLNALAPGDFAKKTLFLSTGAEAVENAVKIARAYTGRPRHHRVHRRLPRPHDDDARPDRQGRAVQDRLRPVPRRGVPRAVPERAARHQRRRRAALGRHAVQERHRGRARGRLHRRAGAGRRRLLRRARTSSSPG